MSYGGSNRGNHAWSLDEASMHAWQFARALGIAERHGWTRFVSMQNLLESAEFSATF
jgi:aryl-alcohol dehydrogenase (NADP+)